MCGFLRARVARLVSVEMQGKLDILAENVEEDGFVAGECFFQDDSAEGRSGAGCLPRLMLSADASRAPVEAPHPEALRLLEDGFGGELPVTSENL